MKTIRFNWLYKSSQVTLSLVDGQSIEFGYSEPTDEGHSWCYETFTREGDFIYCDATSGGTDCDGRIESFHEGMAHISSLNNGKLDFNWDSSQRDQYAEAAGY